MTEKIVYAFNGRLQVVAFRTQFFILPSLGVIYNMDATYTPRVAFAWLWFGFSFGLGVEK